MNSRKWTAAEVATLRKAWADGSTPTDIKQLLPGRSVGAISTKATDIRLKPRVKTGAIGGARAVSAALRVSLSALASREPRAENAAVEAPREYWEALLAVNERRYCMADQRIEPWDAMSIAR